MRFFELDFPDILEYKHRKFQEAAPDASISSCFQYAAVAVDFNDPAWCGQFLSSSGFNASQPTLWLVEGLTMYLLEDQIVDLFTKLREMSAAGSKVIVDFFTDEYDHFKVAEFKDRIKDPQAFMDGIGWKMIELKDY